MSFSSFHVEYKVDIPYSEVIIWETSCTPVKDSVKRFRVLLAVKPLSP